MSVFHWEIVIIYIFSVSLKFGEFYITGQWGKFRVKNATLWLHTFCCWFSLKVYVFFTFISFFEEASNFRNRILTNQKPELVIRNCRWNCMICSINKSIVRNSCRSSNVFDFTLYLSKLQKQPSGGVL